MPVPNRQFACGADGRDICTPTGSSQLSKKCVKTIRQLIEITEAFGKQTTADAETISALRKQLSELSSIVAGQEYEIKKLKCQLATEQESVTARPGADEIEEPADKDDEEMQRELFGRMAARKAALLAEPGQLPNPEPAAEVGPQWTKERKNALCKAIERKFAEGHGTDL